jgi:hypothetical protein
LDYANPFGGHGQAISEWAVAFPSDSPPQKESKLAVSHSENGQVHLADAGQDALPELMEPRFLCRRSERPSVEPSFEGTRYPSGANPSQGNSV